MVVFIEKSPDKARVLIRVHRPARRQAGGNCRHLAFPSEKVCGLFRFDADEFFHGAMVDSAVTVTGRVHGPGFAKLA